MTGPKGVHPFHDFHVDIFDEAISTQRLRAKGENGFKGVAAPTQLVNLLNWHIVTLELRSKLLCRYLMRRMLSYKPKSKL